MAIKTQPVKTTAEELIALVDSDQKREDSLALLKLMKKITGEKPVVWSNGTIGFGIFHYKSARSKQEGDWMLTGFAPRKANITLYLFFFSKFPDLMKKLGKHKTGGGCVYINKLADVDAKVLEELIVRTFEMMKKDYTTIFS